MADTKSPPHNNGELVVPPIGTTIEAHLYLKPDSDTVIQLKHISDTSAATLTFHIGAKDIVILATPEQR